MGIKTKVALSGLIIVASACVHSMKAPTRSVSSDTPTLIYPQNYQVFQRETETTGFFLLNLKIVLPSADEFRLEVFDSQTGEKKLSETYREAAIAQGGEYKKIVNMPAGGWYRLEVDQVDSNSGQTDHSSVAHFGVGDVFVTAGQSNSTSSGEDLTQTETGMVSAYIPETDASGSHIVGPGRWQLNNDPQPPEGLPTPEAAAALGYSARNFGSTWPTMGDELYRQYKVPIATVETGVGGTTIEQWQKNYQPETVQTKLQATHKNLLVKSLAVGPYVRFMETVKKLLETTGVRMILWHQGESDNLSEEQTFPLTVYGDKFRQLQADLTADVKEEIPWMMALASFAPGNPHLDGSPCDSESAYEYWLRVGGVQLYKHSIRLAQAKLIYDRFAFSGPDTDRAQFIGAEGRYPNPRGACIHFSRKTQIGVGKEWANKIAATKFNDLPTAGMIYTKGLTCTDNQLRCFCTKGSATFCPNVEVFWKVRNPKNAVRLMANRVLATEMTAESMREYKFDAPWIGPVPVVFRLYDGDKLVTSMTVGPASPYGKPTPK